PYELLIATRLSAQCTDARVNLVTEVLFARFDTLESIASAPLSEMEELIRPCGLYKTKARDILSIAQNLLSRFGGVVPDNMEDLLSLSGVGRKTANLILGDVYHLPSVVCDTHCIRITNLMGLTTTKDPLKCEIELVKLLPPEKSNDFCHRMVLHGRAVCRARSPRCEACCANALCNYGIKTISAR
ncbi:MAG: endonuclease III, partial [Acetanaerobacterium sp.]